MKELKNLEAIRELLASHPIYTYDYSDGLLINKEDTNIRVYSIDLEDEPFAAYISGYIITGLKKHLRELIQDDEQDEDMISQYTSIYNAIEKGESDHRETEIPQYTSLYNAIEKWASDYRETEISQYTSIYNAIEKGESDEIQVVTNLFIADQEQYHIQLSGNYPEESDDWNNFLEENQWKIYPLLANIMQVFLPTGNYQIMYTLYPQGFISVIAKPINK
jgi:hypothetical protein